MLGDCSPMSAGSPRPDRLARRRWTTGLALSSAPSASARCGSDGGGKHGRLLRRRAPAPRPSSNAPAIATDADVAAHARALPLDRRRRAAGDRAPVADAGRQLRDGEHRRPGRPGSVQRGGHRQAVAVRRRAIQQYRTVAIDSGHCDARPGTATTEESAAGRGRTTFLGPATCNRSTAPRSPAHGAADRRTALSVCGVRHRRTSSTGSGAEGPPPLSGRRGAGRASSADLAAADDHLVDEAVRRRPPRR